jgi:hypothetical protein
MFSLACTGEEEETDACTRVGLSRRDHADIMPGYEPPKVTQRGWVEKLSFIASTKVPTSCTACCDVRKVMSGRSSEDSEEEAGYESP